MDGYGRSQWRLPSYIWQEHMRRAWLEAAERSFREGYEESQRVSLAQSVIMRLLLWRGMEVPASVRRRIRASENLEQLRHWRDRAYEVNDPMELFTEDSRALTPPPPATADPPGPPP